VLTLLSSLPLLSCAHCKLKSAIAYNQLTNHAPTSLSLSLSVFCLSFSLTFIKEFVLAWKGNDSPPPHPFGRK